MIPLANARHCRVRSSFLFSFGSHLVSNGVLLLVLYCLAAYLDGGKGRELLGWVVPPAQGCFFFAAILFVAGLLRRNSAGAEETAVKNWTLRTLPFESEEREQRAVEGGKQKPSAAELQAISALLKSLGWKMLHDLLLSYFAELGFRIIDRLSRSQGVDFYLCTPDDYSAIAVRCMPPETERVDLTQVRSCHRAMMLAGAVQGVIVTTGSFDDDAIAFAKENALELIDGANLAARLLALPKEGAERVLAVAENAESARPPKK